MRATFAAGCFWGIEAAFREVPGVQTAMVGYTGGHVERPTYGQVCGKGTGHAEAVEVVFDPDAVSFEELLDVFVQLHDPTSRNRQGFDIGPQYRSAIFVHDDAQRAAAEAWKAQYEAGLRPRLLGRRRQVATEIADASTFWPAEEHHQRYHEKTGRRAPKVKLPQSLQESRLAG
ncbi:MAG: peptide-methionine (S)-S-oxide reductase MsrA [Solirubrobacterales bacterium]|nr:peptide-methionine (S)-S-oxide reductase MsrA [Solirubrobacterales bacterium]